MRMVRGNPTLPATRLRLWDECSRRGNILRAVTISLSALRARTTVKEDAQADRHNRQDRAGCAQQLRDGACYAELLQTHLLPSATWAFGDLARS